MNEQRLNRGNDRCEADDWCGKVMGEVLDEICDRWFPYDYREADYGKIARIPREPFRIADVSETVERMSLGDGGRVPQEWVGRFWERIASSGYRQKGVMMYACRVFYDPDSRCMYAEDAHRAEARIMDEKNRPVAYVRMCDEASTCRLPAGNLEDFLYDRKIPAKTVRFAPGGIDRYYAYRGDAGYRYFVRQTPEIRDARRRAGSAEFIRYDANMTGCENDFGLTFAVWEDCLVENGVYVSDSMTDEDYRIAIDGYVPGGWRAKELARIYNARKDGSVVRDAAERFSALRDRMQAVIDVHADEICDYMLERMGLNPAMKHEPGFGNILHCADQRYGFDCGWVHFVFRDEGMHDTAKTASLDENTHGVYGDGEFSLNLPYATQSTTVQCYEADMAIRLIESECGISLSERVRLD